MWGSALIFGAVHLMNGSLDWISAIQLVIAGTVMGMLLNTIYISKKKTSGLALLFMLCTI
ncbi:hypothetical protein [Ligilactobacillus saerimneri]|uniref:hypothetical protein n=1 Tax=Ligilactobacillus saerimneri TaxID=228229 RepID=UPI0039C0265F